MRTWRKIALALIAPNWRVLAANCRLGRNCISLGPQRPLRLEFLHARDAASRNRPCRPPRKRPLRHSRPGLHRRRGRKAGTQNSAAQHRRPAQLRLRDARPHDRSRLSRHARRQEWILSFLRHQGSARRHSRRGGPQGDHEHSGCLRHLGRQRDGRHLPGRAAQSGRQPAYSLPRLSALFRGSGEARNRTEHLLPERRRRLAARSRRHQEKDHAADARHCADQSQQPDRLGLHARDARTDRRTRPPTQSDHLCR